METRSGRVLPAGKQWIAHSGRRARLRNMRQRCRAVLAATDPETISAIARLRAITADEPEPEYGLLHLVMAALEASEGTGISWVQCAEYLLGKFEKPLVEA